MSAESHKIRETLEDPLADLDDCIGTTDDDVRLLADIKRRIGSLLENDGTAEREIRALLQERYDDGRLRKETYQLVRSLLDGKVTEDIKTEPRARSRSGHRSDVAAELSEDTAVLGSSGVVDDDYSATDVIRDEPGPPETADDQVQVGSVLRDRFLLQERVAGGSMGVVYKALDRRMAEAGAAEPWVAIKVLSPQLAQNGLALRALQQEAAKGRCLAHSNIVRFIDLDRDEDLYFIVMEWMEGDTLAAILDAAEGKPMDVGEALGIVMQVGKALDYAHRCGIVHADVKPGNIMILPNGDAKLFDFGVARVRQTQESSQPDFNPSVLGAMTPAYSSMQVLTGEEPVPTDDVFSLGCLFYRLVAGYRVFGPRNAAEAAEEGMTPQPPPSLSDTQWRALKKALSYSRVTRFQSVNEFLEALDGPASGRVEIAADERFPIDAPQASRSWLFGLVALLGVIAFGVYQFGLSDRYDWDERLSAWYEDTRDAVLAAIDSVDTTTDTAGNEIIELEPEAAPEIMTASETGPSPEAGEPQGEVEATDEGGEEASAADQSEAVPAEPEVPLLVDYASLPRANYEIPLAEAPPGQDAFSVVLREDGDPVVVDLMRTGATDMPMRIRIEEVSYTGNRSPWAAGQYTLSEEGTIEIPAGQDRARVTLQMASDPLREADQVSTLRIRPPESTTTQYATLDVTLQDDDQRAFEAEMPTNTIAFAVSQVSVRERDPVVQIDVLRFNPDDSQLVVGYEVRDITATEGEDYFAPGGYSVSFGPGQRSARLLIPLVQDTIPEGNEAFTVELAVADDDAAAALGNDVYQRIIVMIRDDEIAAR